MPDEDLSAWLEPLERRHFPAGSAVVGQGDAAREIYVVERGIADVVLADGEGKHRIGQIGPGETIGESTLFTGQPSPSWILAQTDLDVVVLDENDFQRLAETFPAVYRNLGAILARRLVRASRHVTGHQHGRLFLIDDAGAPPWLGYALAASLAWHTRRATLLLQIADEPPAALRPFLTWRVGDTAEHPFGHEDGQVPDPRAHCWVVPPAGDFSPANLPATLDELSHVFDILLQLPAGLTAPAERRVRLVGPEGSGSGDRPGHTLRAPADGNGRPDAAGILSVPALEAADEAALVTGRLGTGSPAGRALGWAARDLAGLKVGIAFGAGSVKGYAHYGVWGVLERLGLTADYVTGTSIGAIVAATYALGFTAEGAAKNMEETSFRAFRLTLPLRSILSNAGIRFNFAQVGGDTRIEDLDVPLAVVAADIITGQEVVLRRGLLRTAALASMAIPGAYAPLRIGPYTLVDGGIVNPVPVSVAAEMGADIVIAIALGGDRGRQRTDAEAIETPGKPPLLLQTVTRAIDIMQSRIAGQATSVPTILIEPDFTSVVGPGLRDFHRGRPYIPPGTAAAEAAIHRLTALLPWLRD